MRKHHFFQRLPSAKSLKENRFLKPFSKYLDHHALWQLNRRTVAGGVAVGLFFGILFPIAQILLAAVAAICLRVNLPVAAFSTLVTNPFTFAGVYYVAYLVGGVFVDPKEMPSPAAVQDEITKSIEVQQQAILDWYAIAIEWVQTDGMQLVVGLSIVAVAAAIVGYVAVNVAWQLWVRRRWRSRHFRHL